MALRWLTEAYLPMHFYVNSSNVFHLYVPAEFVRNAITTTVSQFYVLLHLEVPNSGVAQKKIQDSLSLFHFLHSRQPSEALLRGQSLVQMSSSINDNVFHSDYRVSFHLPLSSHNSFPTTLQYTQFLHHFEVLFVVLPSGMCLTIP